MLSQRSKWPYRLQRAHYFARLFPWNLLFLWLDKTEPKLWHQGVWISDFCLAEENPEQAAFAYRFVSDALRLIERYDKRRFRRVLREVRCIALYHSESDTAYASYYRLGRRARVNYERFHYAEKCGVGGWGYEWYVARMACVLVHEATHGALDSRYALYNKATQIRVEKICHREEWLFVARLPRRFQEYGRSVVVPLDVAYYEAQWDKGLVPWLGRAVERLRERLRAS